MAKRTLKEVRESALLLMKNGQVELGRKTTTNSITNYHDQKLFEQEFRVIKGFPIPFINADQIESPGDVFRGELLGVPLISVRNERGVEVYLNMCRHRGAQLTLKEDGRNKKFVCPFHGWSYSLIGELVEMPSAHQCFNNGVPSGFHLKRVDSFEEAGIIWVVLDKRDQDFSRDKFFSLYYEDQGEIGFAPRHAGNGMDFAAPFNWKIAVEAFLEVYHFAHAHTPYLSQLQFPNLSLEDHDGKNCRIIVPLKKPASDEAILQWSQMMYFIFPSTFLLFYSDHVALISIVPVSIDQTRFRYIPLVPSKTDLVSPSILQKVEFLKVILTQDIEILTGVQKGIAAGRSGAFVFTRLEQMLEKFHQDLRAECDRNLKNS